MSDTSSLENKKPVRGGDGAYTGLCLTATIFLGLATIGTFTASCIIQGVSGTTLAALTLVFALATITAWLSSHAARLRYRLVEAQSWKPPQWGRAETNADLENPYIIEFEQGRRSHISKRRNPARGGKGCERVLAEEHEIADPVNDGSNQHTDKNSAFESFLGENNDCEKTNIPFAHPPNIAGLWHNQLHQASTEG